MRCSFILLMMSMPVALFGQPSTWSSRGIGGGGALFAPSINPANINEFYVGCDMSELFHTTDFGSSFSTIHFQTIQGGHNSKVQFTSSPNLLYCISYANDQALPVRSTNGGSDWQTLPGNPDPSEETYSINVDYNFPGRVLISYYGGLYFSPDSGRTFALVHQAANSGAGLVVGGVLFDGSMVFVGTNDGLLVSTNGGSSFSTSPVTGIPAAEAMYSFAGAKQGSTVRLFCLTGQASSIYAGMPPSDYWGFVRGVYSLDYGSGNWISRMNGIIVNTDYPMLVAMASNDINTVYLGGSNSSGVPNILKTTNAGTNWTRVFNVSSNQNIATGWCGTGGDRGWGYAECPFGIAVAPNDPSRIVFGDFGFVHVSSDGGVNWRQAYVSPLDQNPAGSNTPQRKSYHSIGLENTTCWQIFWLDANNMFACFSDIKGVRSTDGGSSWSFNYTGHSANTMYRIAKHPSNGKIYAATSNVHDMYQSTRLQDNILDAADAEGKILYSTNGGAAWRLVHSFGHPVFWVAVDPTNTNRMYASVIHSTQGGIFVTNNLQGDSLSTWTRTTIPPRTEGHPAAIVVLDDGTVVCTFSGRRNSSGAFTASSGVFVSTDQGTTWIDRSATGMRYWTKDIVIDPNDPGQNTWYVGVFSGWGGPPNGLGGLYRTTNRGVSWTRINSQDRVTSCTFNPQNLNELYLTTETNGLWRSTNITSSNPTFTLVTSYPFRQPERVFFNPYNPGEVWVSSFGAGMKVGAISSQVIPSEGVPTQFTLAQNYPNPFNPTTTIHYELSREAFVHLVVHDVLGREVKTLVNEAKAAGRYDVNFSAERLASGIYFCRMSAVPALRPGLVRQNGGFVSMKKMVLLK